MKKAFILLFAVVAVVQVYGQIDLADSSAQVVSYWDRNEKQTYAINYEKLKINGSDTTSRESIKYEVEVTVLDSTANSYTIQWLYKNMETNSTDPLMKSLIKSGNNNKVIFKTNELGVYQELVNWKEIQEYMTKSFSSIRKEFKGKPEVEMMLKQLENTFASREAIEITSTKDIQQFHTFHGAKYKLGEVMQGTIKAPNAFGGEPFDSDFSVYLDEINSEDNNFIIRSSQEVNKEQLINATYDFVTKMAKSMKVDPPGKDILSNLSNETATSSRIHGSGWIIYSVQTVTVNTDKSTNVEERVIEIL